MRLIITILCLYTSGIFSQSQVFDAGKETGRKETYAVKVATGHRLPSDVIYKYSSNGWHYILAHRSEVVQLSKSGVISQIYSDSGNGYALNDSSLVTHSVLPIHHGLEGLPDAYTGKGVIIGYVDNGCDITHNDFKDTNGNTRILRYWDQTASVNSRTPAKYGYGQAFDSTDINAGVFPNFIGSGHGTTVSGTGSGNGLANGRNKGVAPDSDIIIVKSPISGSNFTITVAEAVDYIFSVADSLGMPAVVNLSLGSYLGSHDARDPAGLYIDSLLQEKSGRIVVCAAGNSGNWGKYHVKGELNTVDTLFTWLIPNPALAFGSPGIFLDLWADTNDIKTMQFALGADAPGPLFRGRTNYFTCGNQLNTDVSDELYGGTNLIGSLIFHERVVGPNYNLRVLLFTDSLDYKIRFMTKGIGSKYDAWSSVSLGYSNFATNIPDPLLYEDFHHYIMPDSLQTIVSSWACSEKVITVANMHNRKNYVDYDGNIYPSDGGLIPPGQLSVNSSKGPSRRSVLKPDITATGDMSLSARVMSESYLPSQLDEGGLHVRNGGTSMASPVVAGIAALYLEKCPQSNWLDFKNDLYNAAYTDSHIQSPLPNYAFGMGKVNALETLLGSNFNSTVLGDTLLCSQVGLLDVTPTPFSILWNTGESTLQLEVFETDNYFATVYNEKGCKGFTDTLHVVAGTNPYPSIITQLDGALIASSNYNYQWYLNGELIDGAQSQTYFPTEAGNYSVSVTDVSGCSTLSDEVNVGIVSLDSVELNQIAVFPNPVLHEFQIESTEPGNYQLIQLDGKIVDAGSYEVNQKINTQSLKTGVYILKFTTYSRNFETKLLKY